MQHYKPASKNSPILTYEIGTDFIILQFFNHYSKAKKIHSFYKYNYKSAGKENIEKMKELASKGEGLLRFINKQQPGYCGDW